MRLLASGARDRPSDCSATWREGGEREEWRKRPAVSPCRPSHLDPGRVPVRRPTVAETYSFPCHCSFQLFGVALRVRCWRGSRRGAGRCGEFPAWANSNGSHFAIYRCSFLMILFGCRCCTSHFCGWRVCAGR